MRLILRDASNPISGLLRGLCFKAHTPLQKWFLAIVLITNAKKSLLNCQLARDLDMNQMSAWFMMQRIRAEMEHNKRDEKTPVLGMVERGGTVRAKAVSEVTAGRVLSFVLEKIRTEGSTLMTDENRVYRPVDRFVKHETVVHTERFVDGEIHTNTLGEFWSLPKRAWHSQHHKYKVKHLTLYVAKAN